ncbi:hypothetical protein [Streptomyces sp. NPDC048639]|uniref:hypothetical protein n=1 Tax=Streptomyces sp. NPDC048639 TaxID=3365581 RepID=UPI00372488FB
MHRGSAALTAAATAVLVCAGCTESVTFSDRAPASSRSARVSGALEQLPETSTAHRPVDIDSGEEQRVLGEVSRGKEHIVAYTEGDKCGMHLVPADPSGQAGSDTLAAWPTDEPADSSGLPLGPYSVDSTSSYGHNKASWATLRCSKDAIVIEYGSDVNTPVTGMRGSVSTVTPDKSRNDVTIVVAESRDRLRILTKLTRQS